MRRTMILGLGLCVAAASLLARGTATGQAPDGAAHKAWMNDAADSQEDLRDALHAKKGADAAQAALKIEALLAKTEAYWASKQANDVVKIAQDSRALAKQIAAAAKAGKVGQAEAAFETMNARCNACHDLHPEKR
jgi:hypothetical protein